MLFPMHHRRLSRNGIALLHQCHARRPLGLGHAAARARGLHRSLRCLRALRAPCGPGDRWLCDLPGTSDLAQQRRARCQWHRALCRRRIIDDCHGRRKRRWHGRRNRRRTGPDRLARRRPDRLAERRRNHPAGGGVSRSPPMVEATWWPGSPARSGKPICGPRPCRMGKWASWPESRSAARSRLAR